MAPELPERRRSAVVVEVNGFGRYKPGSGPPLQPITLTPRRDSTAYIVNKFVTPIGAPCGVEDQRRMQYLIRWRDLPGASTTISAAKVLDYVSPAELEEWEYKELLLRGKPDEDERGRMMEGPSAVRAARQPARPSRRSSKARVKQKPVETPELSESEKARIPHKTATGPSLSTPRKRTFRDLLGEGPEVEETGDDSASDDTAIARQLDVERPVVSLHGDSDAMDLDGPFEYQGVRGLVKTLMDDSSRSSSVLPETVASPSSSRPAQSSRPARPPTRLAQMANIRAKSTSSSGPSTKRVKKSPLPAAPSAISKVSRQKGQLQKETPPLPPKVPTTRVPSSSVLSSSSLPATPTRVHPMKAKILGGRQPTGSSGTPLRPALLSQGSTQSSTHATPGREPKTHQVLAQQRKPLARPKTVASATPRSTVQGNGTLEQLTPSHGFTPAASNPPIPQGRAPPTPPAIIPFPKPPSSKPKRKKPKANVTDSEPEEQDWEVEKLLGHRRRYDADNKLVHEYQVLWAGNWPPDQNPSWEPERNISKPLIKEYHDRLASQGKTLRTLFSYMPERRYSNVAEAFAGELDHEDGGPEANGLGLSKEEDDDADEYQGEETLLVTEEKQYSSSAASKKPGAAGVHRLGHVLPLHHGSPDDDLFV